MRGYDDAEVLTAVNDTDAAIAVPIRIHKVVMLASGTDVNSPLRLYDSLQPRAYQDVNVGGAKTEASPTGLANDATVYTASVNVDGGPTPISVVGSAAQTYADLLAEIQTDLDTDSTVSIVGGNLRIQSNNGVVPNSSIAITDTDLFSSLTGFVAIATAVPAATPAIHLSANEVTDGVSDHFQLYTEANFNPPERFNKGLTLDLASGSGTIKVYYTFL